MTGQPLARQLAVCKLGLKDIKFMAVGEMCVLSVSIEYYFSGMAFKIYLSSMSILQRTVLLRKFFFFLGYSFVSKNLLNDYTPPPLELNGNVVPTEESNENLDPPEENNGNVAPIAESKRNIVATKPNRPTKSQIMRVRKRVSNSNVRHLPFRLN